MKIDQRDYLNEELFNLLGTCRSSQIAKQVARQVKALSNYLRMSHADTQFVARAVRVVVRQNSVPVITTGLDAPVTVQPTQRPAARNSQ